VADKRHTFVVLEKVVVGAEEQGEGYRDGQALSVIGGECVFQGVFSVNDTYSAGPIAGKVGSVHITNPGCYSVVPSAGLNDKKGNDKKAKKEPAPKSDSKSIVLEDMAAEFVEAPEMAPAVDDILATIEGQIKDLSTKDKDLDPLSQILYLSAKDQDLLVGRLMSQHELLDPHERKASLRELSGLSKEEWKVKLAKFKEAEALFTYTFSECGTGKMVYASGHQYVGQWVNGGRHGHGTYTSTNGQQYVGQWKRGQKNGSGTEQWTEGESWTGEFKNGERHGIGVCQWSEIKNAKVEFDAGAPVLVDLKAQGAKKAVVEAMQS
jgi:hypothetical protein